MRRYDRGTKRRTRTPYACDISERYHRQQISALVVHNSATGIWLYVYIYGVSVWVSSWRLMGSGIGMALVSRAWCKVLRQDTKRRTRTPYACDISERCHRQQISALVAHKSATVIWLYVHTYIYGESVWLSSWRLMRSGIGMALVSLAWCKVRRQDTKRRTRTPYGTVCSTTEVPIGDKAISEACGRWMRMLDASERQVRSHCGSKEISFPYSPSGMPSARGVVIGMSAPLCLKSDGALCARGGQRSSLWWRR